MNYFFFLNKKRKKNLYIRIYDKDDLLLTIAVGLNVPDDFLTIEKDGPIESVLNMDMEQQKLLIQREGIEEITDYVLSRVKNKFPEPIRDVLKNAYAFASEEIKNGDARNLLNKYKTKCLGKKIENKTFVQIHMRYLKKIPVDDESELHADHFKQKLIQEVVSYWVSNSQSIYIQEQLQSNSVYNPFIQFVAEHNNVVFINKRFIHCVRFDKAHYWMEEINMFQSFCIEPTMSSDIIMYFERDKTENLFKNHIEESYKDNDFLVSIYGDSDHFIVKTTYSSIHYGNNPDDGFSELYIDPDEVFIEEFNYPLKFVDTGDDGIFMNVDDIVMIESGVKCQGYFIMLDEVFNMERR